MKKSSLVSLIVVLTLAACDQEQDLRTQRNIQLIERFHGEVWSDGNVDLLDLSNKPIKSVAIETGYRDPYYFSRVFKKSMGISPEKYRDIKKG